MNLEADLIRQARNGDEQAYTALVQQHDEAVFRLAYLIMGDADEAKDVAQETFIRAYQQLDRFDDTRPMRPWLLRIATNLARNRRRALGRYVAAVQRFFTITPHMSPNTESQTLQHWEAQELWEAIRQLDIKDQEVIYLRFMLGLSVQETADILGIKAGTVKSRLSRALDRLKGIVLTNFPLLVEGRQ